MRPRTSLFERRAQKSLEGRVLARAQTLLAQHKTRLCVSYVDNQGVFCCYEGCVKVEDLLAASKSAYFRVYLTTGEDLAVRGTRPRKLSLVEAWELLTDEHKAQFEALGLKPV